MVKSLGSLKISYRLKLQRPAAERGGDRGVVVTEDSPGCRQNPLHIEIRCQRLRFVRRDEKILEKVGDLLGWRGPYGQGFKLNNDAPAFLISGGCGVGPLYFLATRAIERGIPTTVAIGAKTAAALPYVEQFRELGVDLLIATDDGSMGYEGYVTDLAGDTVADWNGQKPIVYACGPEGMLVATHRLCHEHDIHGQLSLERYMKCGFGICGQCAIDGLLVCKDGPVFSIEQLDGVHDFGRARRSATGRRLPLR